MTELTKMNKFVYNKFLKANYTQQQQMIKILEEQMENIDYLLLLMKKEVNQ